MREGPHRALRFGIFLKNLSSRGLRNQQGKDQEVLSFVPPGGVGFENPGTGRGEFQYEGEIPQAVR